MQKPARFNVAPPAKRLAQPIAADGVRYGCCCGPVNIWCVSGLSTSHVMSTSGFNVLWRGFSFRPRIGSDVEPLVLHTLLPAPRCLHDCSSSCPGANHLLRACLFSVVPCELVRSVGRQVALASPEPVITDQIRFIVPDGGQETDDIQ